MKSIAVFSVLSIFVIACNSGQESYAVEVNQLTAKFDSLQSQHKNCIIVNLEEIKMWMNITNDRIRSINRPISYNQGLDIESFTQIRKLISEYDSTGLLTTSRMNRTEELLNELSNDITNGLGNHDEYHTYLEHESKNLEDLGTVIEQRDSMRVRISELFKELKPKMELNLSLIENK